MPVPIHVPPPQARALPLPAAAANEDEAEEEIDILLEGLAITENRPELYFGEANLALSNPTVFFADGCKRLIFDILC